MSLNLVLPGKRSIKFRLGAILVSFMSLYFLANSILIFGCIWLWTHGDTFIKIFSFWLASCLVLLMRCPEKNDLKEILMVQEEKISLEGISLFWNLHDPPWVCQVLAQWLFQFRNLLGLLSPNILLVLCLVHYLVPFVFE